MPDPGYGFVAEVADSTREISRLSDQGCDVGVLRIVERRLGLATVGVRQQLISWSALARVSIHVIYRAIAQAERIFRTHEENGSNGQPRLPPQSHVRKCLMARGFTLVLKRFTSSSVDDNAHVHSLPCTQHKRGKSLSLARCHRARKHRSSDEPEARPRLGGSQFARRLVRDVWPSIVAVWIFHRPLYRNRKGSRTPAVLVDAPERFLATGTNTRSGERNLAGNSSTETTDAIQSNDSQTRRKLRSHHPANRRSDVARHLAYSRSFLTFPLETTVEIVPLP